MKFHIHCIFFGTAFSLFFSAASAQNPGGIGTTNLSLWLKADNGTVFNTAGTGTPCVDGSRVLHWDKSLGSAASCPYIEQTTSVAEQPIFYSTTANKLYNFNPLITCDGGSSQLSKDVLGSDLFSATGFTVIMAGQFINPNSAPGVFFKWEDNPGDAGNRVGFENTSNKVRFDVYTSSDLNRNTTNTKQFYQRYRLITGMYRRTGTSNYSHNLTVNVDMVSNLFTVSTFNPIVLNSTQQFSIGKDSDLNGNIYYSNMDYAEIIIYNKDLVAADMQKVYSYLALKYGNTLVNTSYVNSAAATVWNTALNTAYNKGICGLARDDNSTLLQKQSHSMTSFTDAGAIEYDILTLYLNTLEVNNQTNSGSFASGDRSFFICGTNATALSTITTEVPSTIVKRISREWLSQIANFTNTDLNLKFDLSTTPGFTPSGFTRLLIDNDGNFADATILGPGAGISFSITGSVFTVTMDAALLKSGMPYFTLGEIDPAVPLSLLSFEAKQEEDGVLLKWATASEQHSSHFVVERSDRGAPFKAIGPIIKAAGNSSVLQRYSCKDTQRNNSITSFYRLRQYDQDGSFTLCPPLRVSWIGSKRSIRILSSSRNAEHLLEIHAEQAGRGSVEIFDVNGKCVASNKLEFSEGYGTYTLSTQFLASGLYVLHFSTPDFRQVLRFIKL